MADHPGDRSFAMLCVLRRKQACMAPLLKKHRKKKRRLDNAVAGTSKIRSFFVTTTVGEDKTSEGNPENSKRDAVDVAPSVPTPARRQSSDGTSA